MRAYDLYGILCDGLETARAMVTHAIGVPLVAHESDYHCGHYYRHKDVGEEHFILQSNFDSLEDDWTEPDRTDIPFLLYVNETHRSDELRGKLEAVVGIVFLRHQELG